MNQNKTFTQIGVEASYPGDIVARVDTLRAQDRSWRQIAEDVSESLPFGLKVSHESLRAWYSKATAA